MPSVTTPVDQVSSSCNLRRDDSLFVVVGSGQVEAPTAVTNRPQWARWGAAAAGPSATKGTTSPAPTCRAWLWHPHPPCRAWRPGSHLTLQGSGTRSSRASAPVVVGSNGYAGAGLAGAGSGAAPGGRWSGSLPAAGVCAGEPRAGGRPSAAAGANGAQQAPGAPPQPSVSAVPVFRSSASAAHDQRSIPKLRGTLPSGWRRASQRTADLMACTGTFGSCSLYHANGEMQLAWPEAPQRAQPASLFRAGGVEPRPSGSRHAPRRPPVPATPAQPADTAMIAFLEERVLTITPLRPTASSRSPPRGDPALRFPSGQPLHDDRPARQRQAAAARLGSIVGAPATREHLGDSSASRCPTARSPRKLQHIQVGDTVVVRQPTGTLLVIDHLLPGKRLPSLAQAGPASGHRALMTPKVRAVVTSARRARVMRQPTDYLEKGDCRS